MILKYKTKGNKLKQEKKLKKKKREEVWTVLPKTVQNFFGRFGPNRLEFRTVLPKPSRNLFSDVIS
jgi:hypothetical protein